jgi:hypothetical protein
MTMTPDLLDLLKDLPRPLTASDCLALVGIDQIEQSEAAAAHIKKTAVDRHQSRVRTAQEALLRIAKHLDADDNEQLAPTDGDPASAALLAVIATTGEGAHLPDWCTGWAGKARRTASDGPAWQAAIREAGEAFLLEIDGQPREYVLRPVIDDAGCPWIDLESKGGDAVGYIPVDEKWILDLPTARALAARGLGLGAPLWPNVDAAKAPAAWGAWLTTVEKVFAAS